MNLFFTLLLLDFWAPLSGVPAETLLRKGFRLDDNHGKANVIASGDAEVRMTFGARSMQDGGAELFSARDGVLVALMLFPKRPDLAVQLTKALACKAVDRRKSRSLECATDVQSWSVRVCGGAMILHDQSKEAVAAVETWCELVLRGVP